MKNRYENLYKIIDEIKPKDILEVGTHNGIQAKKMILLAQNYQLPESISYYGFDLWEDLTPEQKEYEHCGKCIATYALAEKNTTIRGCAINLIKGNTRQTLQTFAFGNEKFVDFAFIDGGHHYKTIASDWENVRKVMKKGGVVVFDDFYTWPSTQEENYDIGCNRTINDIIIKGQNVVTFLQPLDTDTNEIHKIRMIRVDI